MRTLHLGLWIADLERSLASCTCVGDEVLGDVPASMTRSDLAEPGQSR